MSSPTYFLSGGIDPKFAFENLLPYLNIQNIHRRVSEINLVDDPSMLF
jgi:hypothetical protein